MTQTRIRMSDPNITWSVEGVATIELGGSIPISYYMDCTTSVNNGAQLMWSRVLDNNPFRVQQINNGTRLVIPPKTQSSSLGIYQCADSATSEVTACVEQY